MRRSSSGAFQKLHSRHRLVCNGDRSFESYLFARRKFLRDRCLRRDRNGRRRTPFFSTQVRQRQRVLVEVAAVNDLPVFTSIPTTDQSDGTYSWNDESEYLYRVMAYDSDWDWQTLELNVTSVLPDWLTFRQDSNGTGLLWGTGSVKDKGTYRIEFTATDSNGTSVKQVFDLVLRIDNYPPVFKSLTTNEEISELVVYLDEDSQAGGLRGWVTPQDFHAEDPDPELQIPARDLEWSVGSFPSSLAHAEVNGSGLRPHVSIIGLSVIFLVKIFSI